MHNDWTHRILHGLGHAYHHEHKHGKSGRANGIMLVFIGILLLPIPFIGIPMIIFGIVKTIAG